MRETLVRHGGCLEDAFHALESCGATSVNAVSRPDGELVSARFDVPTEEGSGYWEFLRLGDDLFAIVCNVLYPETMTVPVAGEDLIEFHFRLSGDLRLVDGGGAVDVPQGSLLVWRQPRGHDITESLSGEGRRETSVTFYFRPPFLRRKFGDIGPALDGALAEALAETCERVQALRGVLFPALTRLLGDFASVDSRQGLLLVKAEALATQIIADVILHVPVQRRAEVDTTRISDRDLTCLRAARTMLLAHHAPPPTIEEIARRVGLSATRLKSGFRQLYGRTIADFATGLRMDAAKELLRKRDRPIAQVSAELGYEFQNSFTVAFRRRWGVLPKDYRRDPLAYELGSAPIPPETTWRNAGETGSDLVPT